MIDVASQKKTLIFQEENSGWSLWAAGPNQNGLITFVDNNMTEKRYRLHVYDAKTRTTRLIFERPGDALWDHSIMETIALAGKVNILAVLLGVGSEQLQDPQASRTVCDVELIDLDAGTSKTFKPNAYGDSIVIDDFARYVYVTAGMDRSTTDILLAKATPSPGHDNVPAAYRLDAADGAMKALFPAWYIKGKDRDDVLGMEDYDLDFSTYFVANQKNDAISVAGLLGMVIGLGENGKIIAKAKQARRRDVSYDQEQWAARPSANITDCRLRS